MKQTDIRIWSYHNKEMYFNTDPNYELTIGNGVISYLPFNTIDSSLMQFSTDPDWGYSEELIAVMEFTGFNTKSGVKIYDGDYLGGHPHGTVKVQWSKIYGCWEAVSHVEKFTHEGDAETILEGSLLFNALQDCGDAWEVIGNIYQTPELEDQI